MKNFDTIRDKVLGSIENRVRYAYNQGYEDGYKAGEDVEQKNNAETKTTIATDEYKRGLIDAWNCARVIVLPPELGGVSYHTLELMYGKHNCYSDIKQEIFKLTPEEAIKKQKRYEVETDSNKQDCWNCTHKHEQCEECRWEYDDSDEVGTDTEMFYPTKDKEPVKFRVGDEVSEHYSGLTGVVTRVVEDSDRIYVTWADGSSGVQYDKNDFELTGKHYPLTSCLLRQLRGDDFR